MNFKKVAAIALNELLIAERSRWVLIFSLVFASIALAVSFAGSGGGYEGFQDFLRTTASLLNLSLYLVPLFALTLGAMSFTPPPDKGGFELQIVQPVSRTETLLGKYAGLFLAVTLAITVGFGAAGIVIGVFAKSADLAAFGAFVLLDLALGLIFLSISALISVSILKRGPVLGVSLVVWFVFVILYDLVVMWIATSFEGATLRTLLFGLLFGNPVDLVRVATLFVVGGKIVFGPTGGALLKFIGGTGSGLLLLVAGLLFWGGVPLVAAIRVFQRKDI
jgi:Cu-processing system permease protein